MRLRGLLLCGGVRVVVMERLVHHQLARLVRLVRIVLRHRGGVMRHSVLHACCLHGR